MGGIGVSLSPPQKNTKTIRAALRQFGHRERGFVGSLGGTLGTIHVELCLQAGRDVLVPPGSGLVPFFSHLLKSSVCPASPPPGEPFYLMVIFKLFIRNCF